MTNQDDIKLEDTPQIIANRLNSQGSTGPRTELGRRKSALNAVKTGLTGHTVLLPTDDVARYQAHVADWFADLKPETAREKSLAQSIADSHWRIDRIVKIEHSLYALGRIRFEAILTNEMMDDVEPDHVPELLDGYIHMIYEKQFRNLGIQEARLRRLRDKELKELKQLQAERLAASQPAPSAPFLGGLSSASSPTANGFVFADPSHGLAKPESRTFKQAYERSKTAKRRDNRRGKGRKAA